VERGVEGGESAPVSVQRGGVYWFDLPAPNDEESTVTGSEQAYRRPGIILQNNSDNQSLKTTVIVPTTTGSSGDAQYITTVFISSSSECVPEDSVALCNQIRVIDVEDREDGYIGDLSNTKLREIERAVEVVIGI